MTHRLDWHKARLDRTFLFLGSIRFAVPILILTIGALIYGTLIESTIGAAKARSIVYGSWWFVVLMTLICLTLILAVVTRYPWRKKHTGFILVHSSLIVIIVSGFLSFLLRVDGTITLTEGMRFSATASSPVPFTIELVDFRKMNYPGSTIAMAYESDVLITDSNGRSHTQTIRMNNPHKFNGWKVYQAGFEGSNTAILLVTKDPGLLPMYVGCTFLCLGILIMYYSKAYSRGHPGIPKVSIARSKNTKKVLTCDG